VRERPVEPVQKVAVEAVGDPEPDGERQQRDDQPRTELAEMLDKRGLLAVAKTARKPCH
jgi:hypothetical protein